MSRDTMAFADRTMPFRIGSDHCPGFSKLTEEQGEVGQVVGKLEGFGGFGVHWDGQDLQQALEKELGDLKAAIEFVITENDLDMNAITRRKWEKYARFKQWHENIQNGRPPNEGVIYGEG
jgi:NTP pyrophosphatase (non-canonical NTP hydrolase)